MIQVIHTERKVYILAGPLEIQYGRISRRLVVWLHDWGRRSRILAEIHLRGTL